MVKQIDMGLSCTALAWQHSQCCPTADFYLATLFSHASSMFVRSCRNVEVFTYVDSRYWLVPAYKVTIYALLHLVADSSVSVLPTFWFFPYFMEPRVIAALPSFTMLDYQVICVVNYFLLTVDWAISTFTPMPQSTTLWLVLISNPAKGSRLRWFMFNSLYVFSVLIKAKLKPFCSVLFALLC